MPVSALRPSTKAEIFADGTKIFSARGEDLPQHTVSLNPLLDSSFWRQMANYAEAITDHPAPFLTQADGKVYQFGTSTLSAVVSYLDHSFAHINDGIRMMREIATSLASNKLHPQIFDLLEFQKTVKALTPEKAGLKAEDLFAMIMSLPTSYYYDKRKDNHTQLMFLTLVPIITEKERYRVQDVVTLPTHHQGIVKNDWHKIKADDSIVLHNDYESLAVHKQNLACIKLPAHLPCDFCLISELEVSEFNSCLQKVLKGQAPSEVCDFEKIEFGYEESTQIDNNAWAYSDPTPGIVLETCGEQRNRTSLSTEGILNINPNCSYTITNGPFVQAQMPSNVVVYPITSGDEDKVRIVDKTTDSVLGEHFERNDLYYVIGLCLGIMVLAVAFSAYCYRMGCTLRYRGYEVQMPRNSGFVSYSRPSRQQVEVFDLEENPAPRTPTDDISPVLANLNRAITGYIRSV
jgi:hypothetical protein